VEGRQTTYMVCQRQPQKPSTRFLPLPDVPDISPPLAGSEPRRRRSSMRSTSYDPQNDLPSPLSLGAYASLASAFTAQSQDDLLTPTDVVVASSASAPRDLFSAYHDVPLEWAGPSRHRPADPCTASPPPLYSEGLKWGSDLSLPAKEQGLPDPGEVPPTFEQPHSGTALGLYIPRTDEPSGCRPREPSVDSTMDCKSEQEQMRAIRATSVQASYHTSSHGRQSKSECGDRLHYADQCSPILCRVPRLLDTILFATSSSVPTAIR
jgi:hypothetical protein